MARISIDELRTALSEIHKVAAREYNDLKTSGNPQILDVAKKHQADASLSYDVLQALKGNKAFLYSRLRRNNHE